MYEDTGNLYSAPGFTSLVGAYEVDMVFNDGKPIAIPSGLPECVLNAIINDESIADNKMHIEVGKKIFRDWSTSFLINHI